MNRRKNSSTKDKEFVLDEKNKIVVRLDYKTIITIRDRNLFQKWKDLYPEAQIISP